MRSLADQAQNVLGAPRNRRDYGYWTPFAEATYTLVRRGHGVSESARAVLLKGGEAVNKQNIAVVRVLYYKILARERAREQGEPVNGDPINDFAESADPLEDFEV